MQSEPKSSRLAGLGRHFRRNFVGYIALFIAVSMTPLPSYAASAIVGTSGIKNGAVTTPKLANNAVKPTKIAAGAVKNAKIANGAVTGTKIADGSVGKADLAAAARGYTNIVVRSTTTTGVAAADASDSTVVCNTGEIAIGGGAYVTPSGIVLFGSTSGTLTKSHPTTRATISNFTFNAPAANGVAPSGWRTRVVNDTGSTEDAVHYAVCAAK